MSASCGSTLSGRNITTVGICCMHKKAQSKPMQEMIQRLRQYNVFEIIVFPEEMIRHEPITAWPIVDCCIPFFSAGFPLEKAIQYARLRDDTFYLTDPASQTVLLDRRAVYRALKRNNIPTVRHVFCNRDDHSPCTIVEETDYILINGQRIDKPFVEKPVDSEDHNIIIYFHTSDGGGARHLFRKVGDKSSEYVPTWSRIRRTGSYIYESFISTQGNIDLKVYTVGTRYQHAEARQAPCVDGVVRRDASGKELRRRVTLTEDEEIIAMKIVKVFRQKVCGFDMLRSADNKTYVCDVNGWSFVKGNSSYYDRAASIIAEMFMEEMQKRGLHRFILCTPAARNLVGAICVFRHADRTPKQKLKVKTMCKTLIDVVFSPVEIHPTSSKEDPDCDGASKLSSTKKKISLTDFLRTVKEALDSRAITDDTERNRLSFMVNVIEQSREGLKMQYKVARWSVHDSSISGSTERTSSHTGSQFSPRQLAVCTTMLIVCKWGGCLTEPGVQQAAVVGQDFQKRIFRGDVGNYTKNMKVYSNNESRVIRTAEVVSAALLESSANVEVISREDLLGENFSAKDTMEEMKRAVRAALHIKDINLDVEPHWGIPGFRGVCEIVGLKDKTPYGALQHTRHLIALLVRQIPDNIVLYRGETVFMMRERWSQLLHNFYDPEKDAFDCTKIPDIFDYINYDVCYNQEALAPADLYPLFEAGYALASFVTCSEYGIKPEEKFNIGSLVSGKLLSTIKDDIDDIIKHPDEASKTRLYFTSESHIHTLRNCLYHNPYPLGQKFHTLKEPIDLHYLTHLVFKVYRNACEGAGNNPKESDKYQIEVHFSSGIDMNMFGIVDDHHTTLGAVTPMIRIHNNLGVDELSGMVKLVNEEMKRQPDY